MPDLGKIVTLEVPLDDTEPLQNALYQQYQYVRGQARATQRSLREGAPEWARPSLEEHLAAWNRQMCALNRLMLQIGRHV